MKMNTRIRYSLRMMVTIAGRKNVINTTEMGELMLVSPKYLRKLAGPLEKDGLIRSLQGIHGGYALNRKPEEINLEMILNALNEKLLITDCLKKNCPLADDCLTRPIWSALEKTVQKSFLKITLAQILNRQIPEV